jgi:tetratricopeptide (TPR) repeat protein
VATKALGYYESRGQDDADLENRVQAFFNIGEVLSIRRQTPRAVEAFRQAQALVERMIQLEPHRQDWKNRLASARANVAAALSEGSDNQEEVLAEFQAAEEILTRALEVDPNDVDALSIFIALKRNAGYFLSVWKEDYEAGVAATREAIALAERLAALDPDNINRRARVASLRINLGADLSDLDRLDEALENYREGLAIARDLLQREPDNVQWKDLEALFQSEIGSSLRYLGRWPEAREALEPSIAKLRALAALDPTNVNWRVTLARALRHLSAVAVEQENYDWEEALKLQNEARAALGEPEDYLSDRERAGIALGAWDDAAQLAMALERWEEASGYLEQGIALAERLAPISEASAKLARTYLINRNFYYNSACLHSLAGRVEQGFQRFAQTLESGYDNFDHIATDPDLENLRQADAERFASLLEQARAAAQKESAEPSEQQPQGQSEAPSEDQPETPSEVPSADAP